MATSKVVVLYEDRRGATPEFGLHKLVIRLIADQVDNQVLYRIHKGIQGYPTKGNGNLLKKARAVDVVAPSGETIVTVFDDDQVRSLLKLAAGACKRDVVAAILIGCSDPARVRSVLLQRNVETILEALSPHASDLELMQEHFERAINQKSLNDRDRILGAASKEGVRSVRDSLLASVPSLCRLRDQIREAAGLK